MIAQEPFPGIASSSRPGAIVLCGGESRRMGQPKAWLPFGDETLLGRVVRLVSREASPVVVVAAADQTLPPLPPGFILVRDAVAGRGPIQGLATGLEAMPSEVRLVYATAVDGPWLAHGWIGRLVAGLGNYDAIIPSINGRLHPLAALYRREAALAAAREGLRTNSLRVIDLRGRLRARQVEADEFADLDPQFLTVLNLNTPEDYRRALLGITRVERP